MAQPITWRNVESRNNDNVARLMDSAGRNMNAGIDSLRGALTDQQNIQTDNRANQRTYNDDQFKNALSGFNSPEELAAAEASGQFDALTSAPNMSQDLVRDGVNNKESALRTERTDQYKYDQTVLDQRAAPLEQKYMALLNAGETAKAKEVLNQNEALFTESNDLGRLTEQGDTTERMLLDRAYADDNRNRATSNRNDDLAMFDISNIASNAASEKEGEAMFKEMARNLGVSPDIFDKHLATFGKKYQDSNAMSGVQTEALAQEKISADIEREGRYRVIEAIHQEEIGNLPVNDRFAWTDETRPKLSDAVNYAESKGWDKSVWNSYGGQTISEHLKQVKKDFLENKDTDGASLSESDLLQVDGVLLRAVEDMGSASEFAGWDDDLQDFNLLDDLTTLWGEYKSSEKNYDLRNQSIARRNSSLQGSDIAAQGRYANMHSEFTLENDSFKQGLRRNPPSLSIAP